MTSFLEGKLFSLFGICTMKLKPQAILFDMDGVLVDSFDSWLSALNESLAAFQHQPISKTQFLQRHWGHDLQDTLVSMGYSMDIIPFCNAAYKHHLDKVVMYPEVPSTLDLLTSYKKAVITNTPKVCTEQILNKFHLSPYFDVVVTIDDVNKGKPFPEGILKACDLLKVRPNQVILIGDTLSDVKAGKNAGCIVIGKNIKADYTITRFDDLIDLFELPKNIKP
jgi:pyrophosphatase PpaX